MCGGLWRLWWRREIYIQDFGGETRMSFKECRWDGVDFVIGQGNVTGCCECGNELSGSLKWGEFLD